MRPLLTSYGCILLNQTDDLGRSGLALAALHHQADLLMLLIEQVRPPSLAVCCSGLANVVGGLAGSRPVTTGWARWLPSYASCGPQLLLGPARMLWSSPRPTHSHPEQHRDHQGNARDEVVVWGGGGG